MTSSFRRISTGILIFVVTCIVAVFGYASAPGWSILDAIYMVVITIFGVGYGEVKPLDTPALKVFTMLVIVAGTTSAVYIVGGFIQMVTEGEIQKALGDRRRSREIEDLENHVIVCGYGRIGQPLTQILAESDERFVVVDASPERIELAQKNGYLAMSGNATEDRTLIAAGINRARMLATVLPDDAKNVFITLTARNLNPEIEIIARGEYGSTESKLVQAGANRVVMPASIGALRIAHLITQPSATDLLGRDSRHSQLNSNLEQIGLRLDEMKLMEGAPLIGKPLSKAEVQGEGAFVIVAVKKADGEMVSDPPKDMILSEGDALVVVGHRSDLPKFAQRYVVGQEVTYRGVKQKVRS
ncbi:Inner membrane protein YbaL [Planctomycetes bacterium Pan216]|uniref:Inner membrane protein YbaL n=1 Tax=Kolteria novifilia TaxID=2527975 RepID=A0A518AX33_9BACT|nr:Inner membrane protein YbaL [Planctomycetes bacterium Pan216]